MAPANANTTEACHMCRLRYRFIVRSPYLARCASRSLYLLIGVSGCIASIIRLFYSIQNLHSQDPNYDLTPVALWT